MSRMGMLRPSCMISDRLSACRKERLACSSITIQALRLHAVVAEGQAGGEAGRMRVWQYNVVCSV